MEGDEERAYYLSGRLPDQFRLPLAWILQYILLAYCIGNYVEEDMHGFGMQLMLKSRSRVLWWSSKCICCVCINLFYFLLLYGMTYGYAWISTGNMSMSGQQIALSLYYGEEVANTSMPELIRMTVLLPVGCDKPHNMRMAVVFPAPLAPRKPKISPCFTLNERWPLQKYRSVFAGIVS